MAAWRDALVAIEWCSRPERPMSAASAVASSFSWLHGTSMLPPTRRSARPRQAIRQARSAPFPFAASVFATRKRNVRLSVLYADRR